MKKHYRAILIVLLFAISQLVFVFATNPCVSVSDEYTYKQISYDLFCNRAVSTFHYPFLYPFILSSSFLLGNAFYLGMLGINILVKSTGLIIIYILLGGMESNLKRCSGFLFIISITPVYFLYSDWIMAENLYAPLFVCSLLFYIKYRPAKYERWISKMALLSMTAGLMSVLLYEVKYLSLVLMPALFIFWLYGPLKSIFEKSEVRVDKKYLILLLHTFFYMLPIISVIIGVVINYCIKADVPISVQVIKDTMGFSVGTGPENTGYKLLPEMKWILCYILYAFLCSILPLCACICNRNKETMDKVKKTNVLFLYVISAAFIYVAARHSSFVDYNDGGAMLKLLGRYVAYIALTQIVILWCLGDTSKVRPINRLIPISLVILTVLSYLVLYKRIFWKPEEDWLNSLRGLDNAGFLKMGFALVGITIVALFFIFRKQTTRVFLSAYIIFCLAQIVSALDADEFYDHDYIRSTEQLIEHCGDQNISVYAIDMAGYIGALQSYGFLFRDQTKGDMWFLQAGFSSNEMLLTNDSRECYFVLNKDDVKFEKYEDCEIVSHNNSNVFYYHFKEQEFELNEFAVVTDEFKDGDSVYFSCEMYDDTDLICIVDGKVIIPGEWRENNCTFRINACDSEGGHQIVLYDFKELRKENISI